MIDGGTLAAFVFFKTGMHLWRRIWVVQHAIFIAAICEGTPNADGTNGIEPVGILHNEAFERGHFIFHAGAFIGDVLDDLAHALRDDRFHVARVKPRLGAMRSFIIMIVELPIVEVVQKRSQLDDE